jgi:hypothetical protein
MEVLMRPVLIALACLLLASACDQPLMGEDYRGEPVFTVRGQVYSYLADQDGDGDFRISLFWSPKGETRLPVSDLIEQTSASVSVEFPSGFEINVFHPPEGRMLVADGSYGLALVLVYRDHNGNGRFDQEGQDESLAGGSTYRIILYAPEPLGPEQSPTGLDLPQGFSVVPIPLACGEDPGLIVGTQDCGEVLGSACQTDSDCGAGRICILELGGYPFPDGYCTWEVSDTSCGPRDGASIWVEEAVWLQSCQTDQECTRPGYRCQNVEPTGTWDCRACWPEGEVLGYDVDCWSWTGQAGCGEHLGAACQQDSDCSDSYDPGICLQEFAGAALPGGLCTLSDPWFGCYPPGGLWVSVYIYHWFLRCESTSACREGYRCDPAYRVCLPDEPMLLDIHPDFTVEKNVQQLCRE